MTLLRFIRWAIPQLQPKLRLEPRSQQEKALPQRRHRLRSTRESLRGVTHTHASPRGMAAGDLETTCVKTTPSPYPQRLKPPRYTFPSLARASHTPPTHTKHCESFKTHIPRVSHVRPRPRPQRSTGRRHRQHTYR